MRFAHIKTFGKEQMLMTQSNKGITYSINRDGEIISKTVEVGTGDTNEMFEILISARTHCKKVYDELADMAEPANTADTAGTEE